MRLILAGLWFLGLVAAAAWWAAHLHASDATLMSMAWQLSLVLPAYVFATAPIMLFVLSDPEEDAFQADCRLVEAMLYLMLVVFAVSQFAMHYYGYG